MMIRIFVGVALQLLVEHFFKKVNLSTFCYEWNSGVVVSEEDSIFVSVVEMHWNRSIILCLIICYIWKAL